MWGLWGRDMSKQVLEGRWKWGKWWLQHTFLFIYRCLQWGKLLLRPQTAWMCKPLAWGTREGRLEQPEELEKDRPPQEGRGQQGHLILSVSAGQGSSSTLSPLCMGHTDSSCHRGWSKICVSWVTAEWRSAHRVLWDHWLAKMRTSTCFWAIRD